MGLWTKGIKRSQSDKPRFEDMILNRHVISKINSFINKITDGDGHVQVKSDIITFIINQYEIYLFVPEGHDNIPWILQSLKDKMYEFYNINDIKPLCKIYNQILRNTRKWNSTHDDNIFLNIDQ